MAKSLEPKSSISRVITSVILHALLIGGAIYVLFLYEAGTDGDVIAPSEMRAVVNNYREKRRERLARQVLDIHKKVEEMRDIRDRILNKPDVSQNIQKNLGGNINSVLDSQELASRRQADQTVEELRFHEVYETAKAMEQEMVTIYREFLAASNVAMRPGYDYRKAYDASVTPRPQRPSLDRDALYATVEKRGEKLDAFKYQVKLATVELRDIEGYCDKLLEFTRKAKGQAGTGISVDMTSDDVSMMSYRGPELMPDEIDYTFRYDLGSFRAIPGRRLVSGSGMNTEWMYIDSWYIIGPFPGDRRRQNLDVRFGPEANVNLDDEFTGKDGVKIGWEYKKVGHAGSSKTAHWKIEPRRVVSYGIWYAFTEIYSDMPRTIWVATGTDDYGKLWVNDEQVWQSPKDRKPYNATENIQPVQLKRGMNKILYRIENAGGTMGFSLLIRMSMKSD
ncbi:MAG: hypothetical protein ACLFV7_10585 [Phycisphaerae bacterium]